MSNASGIEYRLLEIEAWADGFQSWAWNNAFAICTVTVPKEIFEGEEEGMEKFLRDFLDSRGYRQSGMSIESYGWSDYEFQDPETLEPLLAFTRLNGEEI